MVPSVNVSRTPVFVAFLAAVVVANCKPSPDTSRSEGRTGSSIITSQGLTPIVSSSSTAADIQAPGAMVDGPSTGNDTGTPGALVTSHWVDTKRIMDTSIDAPGLQCAPKTFSRRDTLTLRMDHPHGEYLMVVQPDSTMFFLVYPNPREAPSFLLMSSESFTELPEIRFRADVRSRPRIYGRDTLEPVFQKPGNYILETGHNLESDQSSDIYTCTVRLVPEK